MLAKLELWIEYEQEEKLTYNISSLMHGILMEQLDPIYGEVLHRNGQKPFHQSVSEMRNNHFKWTICTLNVEARKQIIDVLVTKKHFYMKHKDLKLKVTKWNLSGGSYDELIEKYYFQKNARNIPIRFVTPTAFKSNGRYVFMPDVHFIFQSLINKYNAFANDIEGVQLFFVAQLFPLQNGGLYICNWQGHDREAGKGKHPQLVEIDSEGKVVWQLNDKVKFGMISTICPIRE